MSSGCGTFASSSPLEGDIDYSHWPKFRADEKSVLVEKQFGNSARINFACTIQSIGIGRRWVPVQPTNYMGAAERDIRVNIKGGVTNTNTSSIL